MPRKIKVMVNPQIVDCGIWCAASFVSQQVL
ncbi:unnamed protein product [Lathyrus sativus]|nr:unnamed protein product [Lathyrus sativus]